MQVIKLRSLNLTVRFLVISLDDSYMIPNGKVSNSFSYDPYGPDSYSINYSKDAQTSAVPSALNAYPNVHR